MPSLTVYMAFQKKAVTASGGEKQASPNWKSSLFKGSLEERTILYTWGADKWV
jgi:hypothetical protein